MKDETIETLYRENLKLKRNLAGVRAELKGYGKGVGDVAQTARLAIERTEQITCEVARFRALCDAIGAVWKFGERIEIDFDKLTESLGPAKSLELADIIRDKFGDITPIGKRA